MWKNIPEYEGLYQISNFGRIKSLERTRLSKIQNKPTKIRERVLKPTIRSNSYKYYVCRLSKEGKTKMVIIHRLVAQLFIKNINNKSQVDHIDNNKLNNNVNNLQWLTPKENTNKAWEDNLCKSNLNIKQYEANCYKIGE
jgi:hypothetical protein